MYHYVQSEKELWTVGWEDKNGKWHPESDHSNIIDATQRVAYLNGNPISKRDHFAMAAMQGFMKCWPPGSVLAKEIQQVICEQSYIMADMMIKQSFKTTDHG